VIIVNWNTQDLVLRLLRSLSSSNEAREHELELIVVDNNSSDGGVEAIRREFPAVKLVAQTSPASIEEAARYMADFPQFGGLGATHPEPRSKPPVELLARTFVDVDGTQWP
jgi:glycosyltransferase involved in cell wall biosynthesis